MRKQPIHVTPKAPESQLGSYEGKYPKSLLNKSFLVGSQTIGHVVKDGDTIIIFGESENARYDIPRSDIVSLGGNITIKDASLLENYRSDKDLPLPEDNLRPSAEEIRQASLKHERGSKRGPESRAEAVLRERHELRTAPRDATVVVSTPEGYIEQSENDIFKDLKQATKDFMELLYAGSKVAKKKVQEKKHQYNNKRAQLDSEKIANMGNLAIRFTRDYDRILEEIRAKPIADQSKIYDGLITLMDYQRQLAVTRRDMASRVRPSVREALRSNNKPK